jgi:DNA modification methylase
MNKPTSAEFPSRLALTYRPVGELIPTGLVADALQDVTRHGDLVLDLFLGSGTTLLAAERTGRRFRGLDIDPAYVDVAIERWSARTGQEPRLEVPAS